MDPELDNYTGLDDGGGDYGDGYEARLGQLIVAVLHDDSLDLKAKRKKILKALQLMDDPADTASDEDDEDNEPVEMDDAEDASDLDSSDETDGQAGDLPGKKDESAECALLFRTHRDPAVRRLAERFDRLRAKQRLGSRRVRARQLCERAKLPPPVVTELFLEQLIRAPDERTVRALIEDRRRLTGVRMPRSASPGTGGRMDIKEFAKQLRKGA
jgi:hypothetical protein